MSGLLVNRGGFHAQGTEINGKGVSEEQSTIGTIVTANGTSITPAALIKKLSTVLASGINTHGLSR